MLRMRLFVGSILLFGATLALVPRSPAAYAVDSLDEALDSVDELAGAGVPPQTMTLDCAER